MEVRRANGQDFRAIRGMLNQGVAEGSLQPRKKKDIKKNVNRGRFVVAEHEGELVGTASVKVYDRRIAEVRSLYVSPDQRGNGLARQLIDGVLALPVEALPSGIIFAVTQTTPKTFEEAGFSSQQGQRQILFKHI